MEIVANQGDSLGASRCHATHAGGGRMVTMSLARNNDTGTQRGAEAHPHQGWSDRVLDLEGGASVKSASPSSARPDDAGEADRGVKAFDGVKVNGGGHRCRPRLSITHRLHPHSRSATDRTPGQVFLSARLCLLFRGDPRRAPGRLSLQRCPGGSWSALRQFRPAHRSTSQRIAA